MVMICSYRLLWAAGFVQSGTCPSCPTPVAAALPLPEAAPTTTHPGLHGWGKGMAVGISGRQAPGQASKLSLSRRQVLSSLFPGELHVFPPTILQRRLGTHMLPAMPHGRILGRCPVAKGTKCQPLRGTLVYIRWGNHQDLRSSFQGPSCFSALKARSLED